MKAALYPLIKTIYFDKSYPANLFRQIELNLYFLLMYLLVYCRSHTQSFCSDCQIFIVFWGTKHFGWVGVPSCFM